MRRLFQSIITVFLVCLRVLGWAQSPQTVVGGGQTQAIVFPPGCVYNWTNDKPNIGLAASGTGDIAPFTAINNGTTPIVATIKATPVPSGFAYISNQNSNDVSVIDIATHLLVKTIPLTGQSTPFGVAATPDGSKVYVTNVGSRTVSVISTADNTVIKTIPVGDGPFGIAASPDGSKVYVMNGNNSTISVINTATDVVDATISSGLSIPQGACISPDGKWLYVTDPHDPAYLYIINTATNNVDFTVPLTGTGNDGIAITPDGTTLYIANNNSGTVTVFNTISRTETKVITGFGTPYGVAISRDGTRVYVANSSLKKVSVIDVATNIVIKNINTSGVPFGLSISIDGKELYVANHQSNEVDIISTADNTLITSVPVGDSPLALGMFTTSIGCNGPPIQFSITVNPAAPTINTGPVTGAISACIGTPSESPYIQQFTVSGSDLTTGITATAPADFEVSLSPNGGYGSSVLLNQSGGKVANVVVYVRSAATATTSATDNVVLTSAGAASQNVAVSRVINKLLTVDQVTDKVYKSGDVTSAIAFSGTANTFTWTNDNPAIGLPASGTGDLPSFTAVNTGTAPVIANIKVTPMPTSYAYVANQGSNMVAVINCTTHKVIKSINGGSIPVGIVTSADGNRVYIANNDASTVSVINTADNTLLTYISVGNSPFGIAISPDGTRVYTANSNAASISVIETQNNSVFTTIPVPTNVVSIAVSPDGKWVYAATEGSPNAVYIINASTNVLDSTIPFGTGYNYSMVITPDGKSLYFTNNQNSSVTCLTLATKTVSSIPVGGGPYGIAINATGTRVYVACSQANEVDIINTANNAVIKTLSATSSPFTVSVSTDDKEVYVTNRSTDAVDVFNATSYNKIITITGTAFDKPMSLGSFISKGPQCTGQPITFKITVNSRNAQITATAATGTISACTGSPSASPNIQQFSVSGINLTAGVTATAPVGFEVSLSANSGYGNSVILSPVGGVVTNAVVYVRSAASATGDIADYVVLTSTGAADQSVAVAGKINALPTVNKPGDVTYTNNDTTLPINFAGTGTTFTWTNDTPGIGLPSNGNGDIPPFTAINTGTTAITATIEVTPANATGCPGIPQTFTIKVNASPTITATLVSGSISACVGIASASPDIEQFTVSGSSLTGDINATAPAGFEISLSAATGYGSNLVLTQTGGVVPGTIIYIRSAASAGTGPISGNVALLSAGAANQSVVVTGVINALPTVNKPGDVTYTNNNTTLPINFTGTGTAFTWTNDTPGIGLPANGNGDIPPFTAINTGATAITATITVTPANATGCPGIPQTFTIKVNASPTITATLVSGSISACVGIASANPDIEQFTVSGSSLTGDINATAPAGFEISLSAATGYGGNLVLTQTGGVIPGTIIYVRSAASADTGPISGNVSLLSAGAANQSVVVTGVINALPTVNKPGDVTYTNNNTTLPINFTGTGTAFTWTNDTPGIGLPANGNGDIPPFTAINTGATAIVANIKVTPANATGCPGIAQSFTITVNPQPPLIFAGTVTGTITACAGSPSASPNIQQFTVSGSSLSGDITATAPVGFEISLSANSGYTKNIMLIATNRSVSNVVVYVRSADYATGSMSGDVDLSTPGLQTQTVSVRGFVNALPTVNAVSNQTKTSGESTEAISFTGTGDIYRWTNDNPGIGLPANGTGDIASFISTNNGTSPVLATITVIPSSAGSGCEGKPLIFTISVGQSLPPAILNNQPPNSVNTVYGTPSAVTSFTISGSNMKEGIKVTPPEGLEVSTDGITFGNTVTVGSAGNISPTTVYMRLKATTDAGTYPGNIALTSAGAAETDVAINNNIVKPYPLTIQASGAGKYYGMTLTDNGGNTSYIVAEGILQNGNTITGVHMDYGASGPATAQTGLYPNGEMPVGVDGANGFKSDNYIIKFLAGDVLVSKVPLTITADDKTKDYRAPNPILTLTYSGFVNNESPAQLTSPPVVSTIAGQTSIPGKYPILVSGAASQNYNIAFVYGVLTILTTNVSVKIPNTFTPNGDGINDTWNIANIESYPDCTVNIYNRWGQPVFSSVGYGKSWDGIYKGVLLPFSTYYYVIDLKNDSKPYSGSITIVR